VTHELLDPLALGRAKLPVLIALSRALAYAIVHDFTDASSSGFVWSVSQFVQHVARLEQLIPESQVAPLTRAMDQFQRQMAARASQAGGELSCLVEWIVLQKRHRQPILPSTTAAARAAFTKIARGGTWGRILPKDLGFPSAR
jgi:hypothetical protein